MAEPNNRRMTLEQIRSGRIRFVPGRFSPQRTQELSWAEQIATDPDLICTNWQPMGAGAEAYIKNFGTEETAKFRVLICKIRGTLREAVTVFPRENLGEKELRSRIWP